MAFTAQAGIASAPTRKDTNLKRAQRPNHHKPCRGLIEAELDVRFERMDIARSKEALLLMQLLGPDLPPVLYHRESRQTYQLRPPIAAAAVDDEALGVKAPTVKVDMNRVRALAKGRRLPVQRDVITGQPMYIGAEGAMDQDELLDQQLPPLQRKGRQAMKERSDSKTRR